MYKSIDETHYINAVRDKSWLIISVNIQRLFDGIQNDLPQDKFLEKWGIGRARFNRIKTTLDKPISQCYSK